MGIDPQLSKGPLVKHNVVRRLGLGICPQPHTHTIIHTHNTTITCTCCCDEIKGVQDQDLVSCSFSDSLSCSLWPTVPVTCCECSQTVTTIIRQDQSKHDEMGDTKDVCAATFSDDVRAATTKPPPSASIGRIKHTSHADGTSYSTAQMAPV